MEKRQILKSGFQSGTIAASMTSKKLRYTRKDKLEELSEMIRYFDRNL